MSEDDAERVLANADRMAELPTIAEHDHPVTGRRGLMTTGRLNAIQRAERQRRIVALAKGGASVERIAELLGCHERIVDNALRKAVSSSAKTSAREIESIREMSLQRLDAMLLAIWTKVQEGNLRAIDRALRIEQQRAKLAGIDKPDNSAQQNNHLHLHGVSEEDVAAITEVWRDRIEPGDDGAPSQSQADPGEEALEAFSALPDVEGRVAGE